MPIIQYFESDINVLPGDKVKMRRWFRQLDGVVSYVPGISMRRKEFDFGPIQNIAITTSAGRIYGIHIDPDSNHVRNIVKFVSRGDEPFPLPDVIDDPYIENE
jgi:hypothetical protein